MEFKKMVMITLYAKHKKRQMYRTDFLTLWEKTRVGFSERIALKHVYYQGWNRSPAQVGCMRQALGPGALERPRGIGWRGRWVGGSGWGTHVNTWLIHFNVWQPTTIKKKRKIKASILLHSAFFIVQRSHPYTTAGKTTALTVQTFIGKVMSLFFNMLSKLVTAFLPKSKHLLIPWLQSPSAVISEPRK